MTVELMTPEERAEAIKDAMYRGDTERLYELAPCGCCCDTHYHLGCPAHAWMGCRGSFAPDRIEREQQFEDMLKQADQRPHAERISAERAARNGGML